MAQSDRRTRRRAGLPAQKSVVAEIVFTPARRASAGGAPSPVVGQTYRIIRTTEVDPYEPRVTRAGIAPLAAPAAPVSDVFDGTARKAAKLAIAAAKTESFSDLPDLIKTLPPKTAMKKHKPKITVEATSTRVKEENRNARLRAFLYAASREKDNDFHLIVGRAPAPTPHVYMTAEVSGLPPQSSKSFAPLKSARDAFKQFFAGHLPGPSYDFYDPPIPIEIEGSLFFDMSHASGEGPGPQSLHKDIPTIWEIHPVTSIVFEP